MYNFLNEHFIAILNKASRLKSSPVSPIKFTTDVLQTVLCSKTMMVHMMRTQNVLILISMFFPKFSTSRCVHIMIT